MKNLPVDFLNNLKKLLSYDEYNAYLNNIDNPPYRGIRVNTLKCSCEAVKSHLPYLGEKTPFCETSFYIPFNTQSVGDEPFHHAGAFYVQEPSAASAVTILDVKKGDRVLDLCAAPGGKSTQIAAALDGTGLLWSNEIVKSRANILLSNIERMGVSNCVVSSCHPEKLCSTLFEFFDKVLVDAPCSGEGMFRKDDSAVSEWSMEHTISCGERQMSILESAANALKPGGTLVYSTCTFSKFENECVIERFLSSHNDFELVNSGVSFGRSALDKAVRILPQDGGEGHFAAKLIKKGNLYENPICINDVQRFPEQAAALELYDSLLKTKVFGEKLMKVGDKILLLPQVQLPQLSGLSVLRAGVLLGEIKKKRIEPCHALFMAANKQHLRQYTEFSYSDPQLKQFYHGEEISVSSSLKGFTAVLVEGITTGFGKASSGVLKNKYPKGLRS